MDNIDYIEILEELKAKYPFFINPDLIGLSMFQDADTVYIKSTFHSASQKNAVVALDFVADDELIEFEEYINVSFFNPKLALEENAARFINELDPYSIMVCVDNIFTKDVEDRLGP